MEQYSRRNSIRVTGIPENENEDIGKSVLEMINNRMKMELLVQPHELDRVIALDDSKSTRHELFSSSLPRMPVVTECTRKGGD